MKVGEEEPVVGSAVLKGEGVPLRMLNKEGEEAVVVLGRCFMVRCFP